MPVAKSFQSLTQLCDPFELNGKAYVRVQNQKTGTVRQVRWYTEAEYYKMYPEEKKSESTNKILRTQKEVLGFEKGYITIFKGDTYAELDWFHSSPARYATVWGWYIVSTDEIPDDIPENLEMVRLPWTAVGTESGELKSEAEVKKAVESYMYDASPSEYVGSIGERLTLTLTVTAARAIEGYYGQSIAHTMEDECGNVFVWITSAKNWPVGSVKTIKGTVKEFKEFRNTKQTVLTRCTEVN